MAYAGPARTAISEEAPRKIYDFMCWDETEPGLWCSMKCQVAWHERKVPCELEFCIQQVDDTQGRKHIRVGMLSSFYMKITMIYVHVCICACIIR